jgi:CheY-like chemotaxis protein
MLLTTGLAGPPGLPSERSMRILAATPPEAEAILRRGLGHAAILLPALTIEEAFDVAAQGVDIIVCGIHFDDSRMFELLRAVKADPRLSKTPFVCVRLLGSNLAPTLVQSLEISCALLGAAKFIDLYILERMFGRKKAEDELGRMILALADRPAHSN